MSPGPTLSPPVQQKVQYHIRVAGLITNTELFHAFSSLNVYPTHSTVQSNPVDRGDTAALNSATLCDWLMARFAQRLVAPLRKPRHIFIHFHTMSLFPEIETYS
jgi:hypothetical protein